VLLSCCGSRRWAARLAEYRPYPDLDSLLAAADEASYDLTPADLVEALAEEPGADQQLPGAPGPSTLAACTALRAAHSAYENRFGHAFVICLDRLRPDEALDHVLAGIRARLGHEAEEERAVTAEELRHIARGRLTRLMAE
jgi:2-oxo-4-hydroxy-4-carboxy-5-ureidoimidazoline decarboxylase